MSTARGDGIPQDGFADARSFDVAAYRRAMLGYGVYLARFEQRVELVALVRRLGEPHAHDADGTLLWDVRPTAGAHERARSRTDLAFALHTDCSFEDPPPRFFALYVVRADREGGGRSVFLDSRELVPLLDDASVGVLRTPYPMQVPPEFRKGDTVARGAILSAENEIRYRRDCIIDGECTSEQLAGLGVLDELIAEPRFQFTADVAEGSVLFVDNRRVLHGRTRVRDQQRFLQRVRYS